MVILRRRIPKRMRGILIETTSDLKRRVQRVWVLATIILAGEMVFALPFHIARFFRPIFLDLFALTNTQLGDIFAIYGVVAMLSYFPGGLIADRFAANRLMACSLLATAFGGLYLYSIPSATGLKYLFGYWGFTTIFLFWSAMIKATRLWGAAKSQGLAFGLLDGGRGFVASFFASVAVVLLGIWATSGSNVLALRGVILFYSATTLLVAWLAWHFLPADRNPVANHEFGNTQLGSLLNWQVLKNTNVWLQAGIVVAAYCGYKAIDNYGIYAVDVLGMSQLESAEFTTLASYSRPVVAIAAGLIVDRFSASRSISLLFALLIAAFVALSLTESAQAMGWFVMSNLLTTFAAIYALRGVYFALLEESKLHLHSTGAAVGVISFLGYTPDIFFAPITGRILDANPGFVGFQHYFLLLAATSLIGLVLAVILTRRFSNTI